MMSIHRKNIQEKLLKESSLSLVAIELIMEHLSDYTIYYTDGTTLGYIDDPKMNTKFLFGDESGTQDDIEGIYADISFTLDFKNFPRQSTVCSMPRFPYSLEFIKGNNITLKGNMACLFYMCINLIHLDYINTSEVTGMSCLFSGAEKFNGDISRWDTSNVINMSNMFHGAISFDKKLTWVVSKEVNTLYMFKGTKIPDYKLKTK